MERSAKARFLLPRLWAVKMESLDEEFFDGRGRPAVVVVVEGAERRDDRVEVKAWLVGAERELDFVEFLGRGWP